MLVWEDPNDLFEIHVNYNIYYTLFASGSKAMFASGSKPRVIKLIIVVK